MRKLSPAFACKSALLVMGGTATAAQILIIRELLVVLQGTELVIGLILANWLLLEAAGSYWARKRALLVEKPEIVFALLQIVVGLGCIVSVVSIRTFKFLFHLSTGELLSLPIVAVVSLAALVPVAFADGILFPFGCRGMHHFANKREASALVYLFQALGSFFAALVFVTYLLTYLNSIYLAVILLLLCSCSATIYLWAAGRMVQAKLCILCIICCGPLLIWQSDRLHDATSQLRWYEHKVLATRDSVYNNIAVIEEEEQFSFFANGIPYASAPQPAMFLEEKVHLPLLFHPKPKNVLLIGAGGGGALSEILKHPVERIDYTEQDPLIIKTFKEFAIHLTDQELSNPRVTIQPMEGRQFLDNTEQQYEVILVNLPIPSTLLLNRYYTVEFFREAAAHLAAGGLLAMSLPGSDTFIDEELLLLNQLIHRSLKTAFDTVRILPGNENIFLASATKELTYTDIAILLSRLAQRRITAGLVTAPYLQYKLDHLRFKPLAEKIRMGNEHLRNSDLHPLAVFQSMIVFQTIATGSAGSLKWIGKIAQPLPLVIILFILMIFLLRLWHVKKGGVISLCIFSTGFTGMFMNLTLVMAFQIYFGNIYHYVGLLTAIFMLGLAMGSFAGSRFSRPMLVPLEAAITCHILLVYGFFCTVPAHEPVTAATIYLCSLISGILIGAEYPVAVKLASARNGNDTATGGKLYAIDLGGAFCGAIITSVYLLPVTGIKYGLLLLTILKGGSLVLAWQGGRKGAPALTSS